MKQIFAELEKESGEVYKDILRYFLLEEVDRAWKEHLRNMDALRDGIGLRGYGQRDPKLEYKREGFQMFEVLLMVIRESVFKALTRVHVQPQPEQAGGDAQPGNGEPLQLTEEMNSEPSRAAAEAAMAAEAAQKEAREEQQEHVRSAKEMPEDFRHKDVTQDLRYSGTEEDQDLFKKKEPYRAKKKPGRNDPCPSGSGQKYKNCCGRFKSSPQGKIKKKPRPNYSAGASFLFHGGKNELACIICHLHLKRCQASVGSWPVSET